jgi:hypothetical protein
MCWHFDGKFWSMINERINCLAPLGRYVATLVGMQALSNTKCTQNTQIWKSPACVGYFQPVCRNCHPGPVLFFRQTGILDNGH